MNYLDHFGHHSGAYQRCRPDYPDELFAYLSKMTKHHELAWDCGTGNGQAAKSLAKYFQKIIATDLNQAQLDIAFTAPNIEYRCVCAEETNIKSHCVDLITVAQALHWFNLDLFYAQAKRALKTDGLIAAWCYSLCIINPKIDVIVQKLYSDILVWPKERAYIDDAYHSLPFPFKKLDAPSFEICHQWDLQQFVGYLKTWSAVKEYEQINQIDPITMVIDLLQDAWESPEKRRQIVWPLHLIVGEMKSEK